MKVTVEGAQACAEYVGPNGKDRKEHLHGNAVFIRASDGVPFISADQTNGPLRDSLTDPEAAMVAELVKGEEKAPAKKKATSANKK